MKKAIFITFMIFLFFTNYLKAQEEQDYIYKSSADIRDQMKKLGFTLTSTGKNPEGTKKFITFYLAPTTLTFYFAMEGDDCLGVIEFLPKTLLPGVIKIMNKRYIKIENLKWMSFDNRFLIRIDNQILPKETTMKFYIKE